jgi:lysophospholipase L1-like esterase
LRLPLPQTPQQALRLLAALLTVALVVLLASLGTSNRHGPAYHHYVAMGDSFTAAPFVPLDSFADGCNRSSNNYPHLVADAMHIDHLADRSCTGAQSINLYATRQLTSAGLFVPEQFDALSKSTDLVTVGIGANNGRLYAQIATTCRKLTTVCRLYDERAKLEAIVHQLGPELVHTLTLVKERAPKARVLLIGYPKLLPQRGNCSRLPDFRPQDRATFRAVNRGLRYQMRDAAKEAGVEFVDFYQASIGHDVCAGHPWVQARIGSSHRAAALHPLPAGQAALARIIIDVLRHQPPRTGVGVAPR